jgi:hypothetical protein
MLPFLFLLLCHIFINQAVILHCDFETDCDDFVFDYNWGLTDGQHSQGINHDHTLNTSAGHYRYYNPQDTSRFILAEIKTSAWLQPSTNHTLCFHMWYYTPRLNFPFNIQVGQGDDEQLARVLLSVQGKDHSTNDWALINVTLPNEKLKIFIRVNVTGKPLVFDDFSVDYCDGSHPLPPKILYSCDFESSCSDNFVSLPAYPYQASILNASDAVKIESRAPPIDYTFGNASGHYALLPNSNKFQFGNVGYLHLQMPIQITSNESYCFNFQYYSFGSSYAVSNLQIYLWTYGESRTVQLLWPILYPSQYS